MRTRIVIADDQDILRRIVRHALEKEPDFDVVGEARNGKEAIELVAELAPDVIIMDIGMPELSGLEATRILCDSYPNTRIVTCSAYSTGAVIQKMLDVGAQGYVTKRSIGQELCKAIRVVLGGEVYLSRRSVSVL